MTANEDERPHVNYGVQQFGGTSHVGNQAVGTGASVSGSAAQWQAPAAAAVNDLVRLLTEHDAELTPAARSAGATLRAAVADDTADPWIVARLLERLAIVAAPVPAIAEAVQAVLGMMHR